MAASSFAPAPASTPVTPSEPAAQLPWRLYEPGLLTEIDYLRDVLPAGDAQLLGSARSRSADPHELLFSVAESIEARIHAQGRLGEERPGRPEPGEEASEDDFLEHDELEGQAQRYVCRFDDLFCFRGPREDFQRSAPFLRLMREFNEGRRPAVRRRRLRRTKPGGEGEPPGCRVVKTAPTRGVFATLQQLSSAGLGAVRRAG